MEYKNLRIASFILGLVALINLIVSFNTEKYENINSLLYNPLAIAAVVVNVILAKKLDRSAWGWGIFSLFLPFLACFILSFLDESEDDDYSYPGGSSYGSSSYGNTYATDKSCTACGKGVPLSSAAGQHCPHCGVYWSSETETRR